MNRTVIMIVGRLRSGTSLAAQLCHRLGFPAAVLMAAPAGPRMQSDWEDWHAYEKLIALAPWGRGPTDEDREEFAEWFVGYIEARFKAAEYIDRMAGARSRGIACKSPLYAMFIPEIRTAAAAAGVKLIWIKCERNEVEQRASLDNTYGPLGVAHRDAVVRTDALIDSALLGLVRDLCFDTTEAQAAPVSGTAKLADVLDVKDRNTIAAASRCIERS